MKRVFYYVILVLVINLAFISCQKEISCEGCINGNKPPVAKAGPDITITLPQDSAVLNGSASYDPDGNIMEFLWSKIEGPALFNINNTSLSTTVAKNLIAGAYQFELKVTDNKGLLAKDSIRVFVIDPTQPNQPPIANAGPDKTITLPNNSVTLDGTGSTDPENNITSYLWTKISGPTSFNIANVNAVQTEVVNLIQGVYQFELKVTDAGGLSDTDTIQVSLQVIPPSAIVCDTSRPKINARYILVGELSQARWGMAVGSAGGKIVFAGGYGNIISGSLYGESSRIDIYDIASNSWSPSELSPGVSPFSNGSPTGRWSIAATTAGNKIYFAGGFRGDYDNWVEYFSNVDIYDASTNSWSTVYLYPGRTTSAAAANGKVVFASGYGNVSCGGGCITWNYLNQADMYDIGSNTWVTTPLSEGRHGICAVSLNNKIYFAGGWGSSISDKIDIYDATTNTWSTSALSEPKQIGEGGIAVGNKIYWAGGTHTASPGSSTQYESICTVEIRDVITGTISFDNLSIAASTKAILKDNKIIFIKTSYTHPDFANQFDIYDLNTNTWSIGVLPYPIPQGASIISVNNNIYVAGGGNTDGTNYFSQVWKIEF